MSNRLVVEQQTEMKRTSTISSQTSAASAAGTEYIKYQEYVSLIKPNIVNKDELIRHQQKSTQIKNVIDDPFYPDDATLSLFAILVYRKVLKTSFDNALEELKQKDKGDGCARQYIDQIQRGNEWRLYAWAENEKDGYFGAAFWNARYSQLVISHRGTQSNKSKLTDLEGVAQLKYTSQIHSACAFTALILQDLDRSKIHVSITGHSLGGWLGQITTFVMEYLTLKDGKFTGMECRDPKGPIHCVVLDSPGCYEMLRIIAGHYFLKFKKTPSAMISALDITIYFNEPNLVNCCNSHRDISRLLQIFDPTSMISQSLKEESSKPFINKILNYKSMFKTHKGFNFIYLLTTSKDIEIKWVLNWPSFHLPEGVNKTNTKTELSLSKALPKIFMLMSPSFTLWSKENELANHYQKIQESDERIEDNMQEQIGGIDNHYKVVPFNKSSRYAAIFTEREKDFLKYWQQVYDRKISTNQLKNIQKFLESNELGSFENFLPQFNITDNNKNEIMSCASNQNPEDLEKIIRHVKQLHVAFPEVFEILKNDIYDYYVLAYETLSNRYVKKLPNWDVNFEDTIKLINFLQSNESKLLCLSTFRDTKYEMFRVRYIIQNLYSNSCIQENTKMYACFLGVPEFKELRNQVDVEKIHEDKNCFIDKILVIDCKAKANEVDDSALINFVEKAKISDSKKKVILVVNSDTNWSEKLLVQNGIETRKVEYLFSDFKQETQGKFLKKIVATLWKRDVNMAQILSSNNPKQLSENDINFLSQPEILDFLLTDDSNLDELTSSYVIEHDNMKILTANIDRKIELSLLLEFLNKDRKELEEIFEKPIMFIFSGISKIEMQEVLGLETKNRRILDHVHFIENDPENFEELCIQNKKKRIYWLHFQQNEEVELRTIFDSNFYIERTMCRQDVINKTKLAQILKKREFDSSTFTFANISYEKLREVLGIENVGDINWRICNATIKHLQSTGTVLIDPHTKHLELMAPTNSTIVVPKNINEGLKIFNEIIKQNSNPVHLINFEGNGEKFLLTRSRGSLETIREILEIDGTIITPKDFFKLKEKMFLIIGDSGSGKTSLLLKIATQFAYSWVLWVNLINFRKIIEDFEGEINLDSIVDFLSINNENLKSPVIRSLFKFHLIHKLGIPVVIFFDGFDEIKADKQGKILEILEFLHEKTNSKIFITSKIWAKNMIENKFGIVPIKIQDTNSNDQKKFIKNFWLDVFNVKESSCDYKLWLNEKAGKLFEDCQTINFKGTLTLLDRSNVGKEIHPDILAIPLQLRIIGETIQNNLETTIQMTENFLANIYEIYKNLISKKIEIFSKEKLQKKKFLKKRTEEALLEKHQCLAFQKLFPNEFKEILEEKEIPDLNTSNWKEDIETINKIGFVTIFNTRDVKFNHISIAEYFIAEKLYKLMTRTNLKNPNLENFLMRKVLLKDENEMIRRFLDGRLKSDLKVVESLKFFTCLEKAWVEAEDILNGIECTNLLKVVNNEPLDISSLYEKVINEKGETALHVCASENLNYLGESIINCFKVQHLQNYLDQCNINYETAFHNAALNMNLEFATKLLKKEAKSNMLKYHVNEINDVNVFQDVTLSPHDIILITYSKENFKILLVKNNKVLKIVNEKSINLFELLKLNENIEKLDNLPHFSIFTLLNLAIKHNSLKEYFLGLLTSRLPGFDSREFLHTALRTRNKDTVVEILKRYGSIVYCD